MTKFISVFLCLMFAVSCAAKEAPQDQSKKMVEPELTKEQIAELETAYFAAGCFWCVEEIYQRIEGVEEAVSGFAGGEKQDPSYRQVAMGKTDYAETVRIRYDSDKVNFRQLSKVFYASHNPTLLNQVGPDKGSQYRSVIFYVDKRQKKVATDLKKNIDASDQYDGPVVTEIVKFKHFYAASEHHQNYERKNPNDSYIVQVSQPRIQRTLEQFPQLLKKKYKEELNKEDG